MTNKRKRQKEHKRKQLQKQLQRQLQKNHIPSSTNECTRNDKHQHTLDTTNEIRMSTSAEQSAKIFIMAFSGAALLLIMLFVVDYLIGL